METTHTTQEPIIKRLQRPDEGRVLGGVAAALANHTKASAGLIRLGFLITALFGGFGVVLYAAAWALIPGQGETESAAELWLRNLTTPGKRAGAFFIGLAALVILAGAAPATVLAAIALLAAAALLSSERSPFPGSTTAVAVNPAGEETE
ncbi:MAG: PspC domain-containing protein [bacterium]|nr:PspC domain-containing protein [bacterium]MCP4968878.1 PspC domain-containing protein [bacterium]